MKKETYYEKELLKSLKSIKSDHKDRDINKLDNIKENIKSGDIKKIAEVIKTFINQK